MFILLLVNPDARRFGNNSPVRVMPVDKRLRLEAIRRGDNSSAVYKELRLRSLSCHHSDRPIGKPAH